MQSMVNEDVRAQFEDAPSTSTTVNRGVSSFPTTTTTTSNATGLTRMTSTRRYMEQLDDSDDDELDLTNRQQQQNFGRTRTDTNQDVAAQVGNLTIREDDREETAGDTRTKKDVHRAGIGIGRVGGNPQGLSRLQQQRPSPLTSPTVPSHADSARSSSNPIVRIGPPSPDLQSPGQQSTGGPQSPPVPIQGSSSPTLPSFTASPRLSSGDRALSQQPQTRNFSRPFNVSRKASNRSARSNSVDSQDSRFHPSSSLGHSGSSMDHGGSSQGGHSMSSSWEDRQKIGFKLYEKDKANAMMANLPRPQMPEVNVEQDRPGMDFQYDDAPSPRANYTRSQDTSVQNAPSTSTFSVPSSSYPVYSSTESHPFPRMPVIQVTDSPPRDSHRSSWRKLLHRNSKENGQDSPKQASVERPISSATSMYSQTSSTPTIRATTPNNTGQGPPPSRSMEQLSDLASRARELTEHRRQFDDTLLRPSVARSAQASFVHAGEFGVSPDWLDKSQEEQSRLIEQVELQKLQQAVPLPLMKRTKSDQGQSNMSGMNMTSPAHGQFHDSDRMSHYSEYTAVGPQSTRKAVSANTSPMLGSSSGLTREVSVASHLTNDTLRKATMGLKSAPLRTASGKRVEPESAYEFLQLGIEYHEDGELQRAAWCFEQSARREGGCAGGMLMYGLTLQHGWGCQINAALGFRYLQGAAESIVQDLDQAVASGTDMGYTAKTAQNELKLALYEMGQSFRFGYGVDKDKKMAVAYFQLAADLGDMDAQQDLAFCLANGKGCKKNPKLAAKYYRLAVKQGASDFGLSWIWKDKYNE
ncbi:hypothetical protein OIO90_001939 [Microbotryomycetes sp. JL221]|nr:hypothetical protein OIO90_001939 [Microbotryomycetes sp. JL221]